MSGLTVMRRWCCFFMSGRRRHAIFDCDWSSDVCSSDLFEAESDSPVYCASKGAIVILAKALALDYATRGIRVNALCPGIIDTPMLRRFADAMPDPAAAWAGYSAAQPMGRLGTPDECAAAALWLVSDDASFVTGVALPVDGGFTAM